MFYFQSETFLLNQGNLKFNLPIPESPSTKDNSRLTAEGRKGLGGGSGFCGCCGGFFTDKRQEKRRQ